MNPSSRSAILAFTVVLVLAALAPAQTFNTLYNFGYNLTDGSGPLAGVIQEAKRMANEIQQSSDLWDLEHYLTQRRKEIDRKYDFRGSQLTDVLGRLLYENRLGEEDLRGLPEEKMKSIRSFAQFLRDGAA